MLPKVIHKKWKKVDTEAEAGVDGTDETDGTDIVDGTEESTCPCY